MKSTLIVNTHHCRAELDTVQYVIKKYGYKETRDINQANVSWYGLALRDHDIDVLKQKACFFNRYPLMDHFAKKNILCVIISRL